MIISEKLEYVFISTPKCATHSIYKVLTEKYHGQHLYKKPKGNDQYHARNIPAEYKDFFTFSVVRHPYHRLISLWLSTQFNDRRKNYRQPNLYKLGRCPAGLLAYLEWLVETDADYYPSSKWLDGIRLDTIMHVEGVTWDFLKLPFVHIREDIPRMNETSSTWPIDQYLTAEIVARMDAVAEQDFRLYKYRPGVLSGGQLIW